MIVRDLWERWGVPVLVLAILAVVSLAAFDALDLCDPAMGEACDGPPVPTMAPAAYVVEPPLTAPAAGTANAAAGAVELAGGAP